MKLFKSSVMVVVVFSAGISTVRATTYYWDRNDGVPGANPGAPSYGDGTWDTTSNNWNLNADGSGSNVPFVNGSDAVFSAGSDLVGTPLYDAALTIAAGTAASSVEIQEGIINIASGQVNTDPSASGSPGPITVDAGAAIRTVASSQFQGGGKITLKGTSTADAGAIIGANTGNAGSMVNAGSTTYKTIEIDGFGRVSYDDANGTPDNQVSILSSNVFTGVGGTPTNGGTGTLVKSGPDQIGYAVKDTTGGGVYNFTLNSFAKLRVEQGGFRLRNLTVGALVTIDERLFGAVPLSVLPDAITLDGGGIGTNATITLNANRGITISNSPGNALGVLAGDATKGGGYFDHGAGASMVIPGPLSGSGNLYVGDPTSTAATAPAFTLQNANNVNTFTGGIIGVRGTLTLSSSLKAKGLSDVTGFTQNPANNATISVATGQTLTSDTGGGTYSWGTAISGAGGFIKSGAGTQNLTGTPTYAGDTKVQGGTLSISNAYLADAADVYLSTGSTFNLNFAATDTIRSLYFDNTAQAIGTWARLGQELPTRARCSREPAC